MSIKKRENPPNKIFPVFKLPFFCIVRSSTQWLFDSLTIKFNVIETIDILKIILKCEKLLMLSLSQILFKRKISEKNSLFYFLGV